MFELSGSNIEKAAIDKHIVQLDDRDKRDIQKQQEANRANLDRSLQHLGELWDTSGIDVAFQELETVLGSTWFDSNSYPIVRVAGFIGMDTIPRPVKIGARVVDCARTLDSASLDINGVYGKVLLYRTVEVTEEKEPFVYEKEDKFHDQGFYCFLVGKKDTSASQTVPHIVYGDLDAAKWGSDGFKLRFIQEVLQRKVVKNRQSIIEQFERHHKKSIVSERSIALSSLLDYAKKRRWNFKRQLVPGVFRQNEQVYIPEDEDLLIAELHMAMQQFIDTHFKPEISKPHVLGEAKRQVEIARVEHDSTGGIALSQFDIAKAAVTMREDRRPGQSKTVRVQKIIVDNKYNFLQRVAETDYHEALSSERQFPFISAVRKCFMGDDSDYLYAVRDLLSNKKGASLRAALSEKKLTLEQLKLCRSKLGPFAIYEKRKLNEEIALLESKQS